MSLRSKEEELVSLHSVHAQEWSAVTPTAVTGAAGIDGHCQAPAARQVLSGHFSYICSLDISFILPTAS